jgi:MoaA/NifB/PqqE/SkfB family radical SAM enzyme
MNSPRHALEANLTDVFGKLDGQGSHVGERLLRMIEGSKRVEAPPFPRQIQIETSNICNHQCEFCAYTLMQRPKGHMDRPLFERLVAEAYDCGAREIGLFAGAEPLTCKWIDEYIAYCKSLGYEYIYISTNGTLGGSELLKKIFDAGLSSIKFSVNGGDRETYKMIHGRDEFDKVIENIKFISAYREKLSHEIYLGVSFVGLPHSIASFDNLKSLVGGLVDEIIYYEASNQSGQMPNLPSPPYRDCHLPFNKIHISKEGYIKACCNDYENLLAIEDLNKMSLMDGWHSDRFRDLRRRHLNNALDGSVCGNCIRASTVPPQAENPNLVSHRIFWGRLEHAENEKTIACSVKEKP